MLALTGLSLVLAVLSWHYVELPFRRRTRPLLPGKRALFRASGVAAAALVLLGVAGDLADGLPGRGSRAYHAVLDAAHDRNDRQTTCLQKPEHYDAEAAFARCSDGVEGSFRVALLGTATPTSTPNRSATPCAPRASPSSRRRPTPARPFPVSSPTARIAGPTSPP